jgi:hypothetical protein
MGAGERLEAHAKRQGARFATSALARGRGLAERYIAENGSNHFDLCSTMPGQAVPSIDQLTHGYGP